MNNSDNLKDLYIKYKFLLSGINNIEDAIYYYEKITQRHKNDILKKLLSDLIQNKSYNNASMSTIKFMECQEKINKIKFKNDIQTYINDNKNFNQTQIRALQRFMNSKPDKPYYITLKELREKNRKNKNNIVMKQCPHCNHPLSTDENIDYVICGYHPNASHNSRGCGKDWCFKCGKKLCKLWSTNQLFILINRQHDNKCCKKHAQKNKYKYPEDYCNCLNSCVMRK